MLSAVFVRRVLESYAVVLDGVVRLVPRNVESTKVFVVNNSSEPVYLGADENVNEANGFPVFPGDVFVFICFPGFDFLCYLYGSGQEIRVLEVK
jgi:hypothetical protein